MKAATHIHPGPSSQHGPETTGNLGDTQRAALALGGHGHLPARDWAAGKWGKDALPYHCRSQASWAVRNLNNAMQQPEQGNHYNTFVVCFFWAPASIVAAYATHTMCAPLPFFLLAFNFNTATQTSFQGHCDYVLICQYVFNHIPSDRHLNGLQFFYNAPSVNIFVHVSLLICLSALQIGYLKGKWLGVRIFVWKSTLKLPSREKLYQLTVPKRIVKDVLDDF